MQPFFPDRADQPAILITGATGMIGGALALLALQRGYSVRTLVRPGSDTGLLDQLFVETVEGDVTDAASVRAAVEGCGMVFHAAAVVSPFSRDGGEFHRVNVGGTRNVLEVVAQAGVRRMLHVSSIAALGAKPGVMADESTRPVGPPPGPYAESKRMSEQLVMDAVSGGLDAVIVNPAVVFGPRDRHFGRMMSVFLRGRLPVAAFPERRISLVYADDVALGCLLAVERAAAGSRYILAHPPVTIRDFFRDLAAVSGRRPPRFIVPGWLAAAGVAAARALSPVTRVRPPMSAASLARGGALYDGSLATRELGLTYTPMRRALADTVAWLQAGGRGDADRG